MIVVLALALARTVVNNDADDFASTRSITTEDELSRLNKSSMLYGKNIHFNIDNNNVLFVVIELVVCFRYVTMR